MKGDDLTPGLFYKTSESNIPFLFHKLVRTRSPYGKREMMRAEMENCSRRVVTLALSQIQRPATDEQVQDFIDMQRKIDARRDERQRVDQLPADEFEPEYRRLKELHDVRQADLQHANQMLVEAQEAFEPFMLRRRDEERARARDERERADQAARSEERGRRARS